ncbi:30S ribosomal protein THX [Bacteroidetes bacterium endosymbiont of Geopemphigus sp.]|nr:30S ribosomal protein THX [Bacteroidetes bacterium endosymbiont of Geopemphigus sp.]
MGKGDQKTRHGKINRGTYGSTRLSQKNLRRKKKTDQTAAN